MRYLIKTNLHMKLGTDKFLPGSCGLRVGAVLADDATAQFSSAYGQQIAELSNTSQPQFEVNERQDHNKISQPLHIEIPQPSRDDLTIREETY
ncbi:MAG: hypothetical protein HDT14_02010 [Oscillibacter sp.]|nr:hypothetical protein [Oscillibacter sp.]